MLQVPNAVPTEALEVAASTTFTVPATVSIGDLLYLTGADSADRADNTNAGTMPAVALCVSKPSTTLADAIYLGEPSLFSGLTPAATQYVGLAGALTESVPIFPDVIQEVGEAINATTLLFHPKKPSSSTSGLVWKQDEFSPANGQVTFILSNAPVDSLSLEFYVNGVLSDDVADFTVSGVTVTWLNTEYSMSTTDKVIIRYK